MNFEIHPREVFVKLLCLIFALLFFNVMGVISRFYFDHDYIYWLIRLLDFDTEKSIPTLYSTLALLFASTLLSIIAITHKRNGSAYLSWLGLAFIFLFLSIDEIVSLHEHFDRPVRESLNTSGAFYFAWIIPYGIALIALMIFYFKFLTNLPRNIMILFVVSGATYVSGAVGFEMVGGRQAELYGTDNLLYSFFYTCEEFLEMLGIVIFIYALLTYILSQFKSLTITVNEPN